MSKKIEAISLEQAAKLALESLEAMAEDLGRFPEEVTAITALREALMSGTDGAEQPRAEGTLAREPLTDEQNRELFAAFVKKNLGDIAVMDGGRYISPKINNYWLVWQEAHGITKGNT